MAALKESRKPSKQHRLVVRISDEDKGVIARAAALSGQTMSSFMVAQARKAALETFQAHHTIALSAQESCRFVEALLAPARGPSARMLRAMALHDADVHSDA